MSKKRIFIVIISALSITGLLSGCNLNNQNEEETYQREILKDKIIEEISEDVPEETMAEKDVSKQEVKFPDEPLLICENNNLPFSFESDGDAHGKFTFTGPIVAVEGPEPWADEDSTVTFLKIQVTEGTTKAVKYFKEMANQGNTVNSNGSDELNFSIGLLKDGQISSTADISSQAEKRILEVMNTGEAISLDLVLPYYLGRGAPANFTFACNIRLR